MIHEQVQKQLDYLKYWVDAEKKREQRCKEWGIPYTPSRRKWEDIELYEEYKKEIERNGDKNLLVMVRLKRNHGLNMSGVYPFARRYAPCNRSYHLLKHYTGHGAEILLQEHEVEIVK